MENTLKIYLDGVSNFNSFLELNKESLHIKKKTIEGKWRNKYSIREMKLTLTELAKKLKEK